MGIQISAAVDNDFPYPVTVTLECDQASGFFCRGFTRYSHEEGYAGAHSAAMADGWLERNAPEGRIWLCPNCSGK